MHGWNPARNGFSHTDHEHPRVVHDTDGSAPNDRDAVRVGSDHAHAFYVFVPGTTRKRVEFRPLACRKKQFRYSVLVRFTFGVLSVQFRTGLLLVEHVRDTLDSTAFVRHLPIWRTGEIAWRNVVGWERRVVLHRLVRLSIAGHDLDRALSNAFVYGYPLNPLLGG